MFASYPGFFLNQLLITKSVDYFMNQVMISGKK